MTWLARFRAPRCPTCRRKVSDCPRRRWLARRVDAGAGRLTIVAPSCQDEIVPLIADVAPEGDVFTAPEAGLYRVQGHVGPEDGR